VRRAVLRLGGLATGLCLLGLLTAALLPVSRAGLQDAVDPFGPFAAPVFVLVSTALALAFVPGPLLAAASGVLFGTALGFVCTVTAAVLTSVLALLVARRTAGSSVADLGERGRALTRLARRHGLLAVVLQRLLPAVPDAPLSYAFGAAGVRVWQIALGTLIGSAPRAFAYTALGRAAVDGDGRLAVVAVAVGVAVSVTGLAAGAVLLRRHRRAAAPADPPVG
jgi:uncharacterized membrane protein YdjX (TVP38/TMEM64 family)